MKRNLLTVRQGRDPLRHGTDFFFRIIHAGNDQACQFHMTLLCRFCNKVLHCCKVPAQNIPVDIILKTLQINIKGICQRKNSIRNFIIHASVGNQHYFQILFPQKPCRIHHILIGNERFIIGKGHPDIPLRSEMFRHIRQCFRRDIIIFRSSAVPELLSVRHGYFPVLAERTVQAASVASDRQNSAAGQFQQVSESQLSPSGFCPAFCNAGKNA